MEAESSLLHFATTICTYTSLVKAFFNWELKATSSVSVAKLLGTCTRRWGTLSVHMLNDSCQAHISANFQQENSKDLNRRTACSHYVHTGTSVCLRRRTAQHRVTVNRTVLNWGLRCTWTHPEGSALIHFFWFSSFCFNSAFRIAYTSSKSLLLKSFAFALMRSICFAAFFTAICSSFATFLIESLRCLASSNWLRNADVVFSWFDRVNFSVFESFVGFGFARAWAMLTGAAADAAGGWKLSGFPRVSFAVSSLLEQEASDSRGDCAEAAIVSFGATGVLLNSARISSVTKSLSLDEEASNSWTTLLCLCVLRQDQTTINEGLHSSVETWKLLQPCFVCGGLKLSHCLYASIYIYIYISTCETLSIYIYMYVYRATTPKQQHINRNSDSSMAEIAVQVPSRLIFNNAPVIFSQPMKCSSCIHMWG